MVHSTAALLSSIILPAPQIHPGRPSKVPIWGSFFSAGALLISPKLPIVIVGCTLVVETFAWSKLGR